MVFSTSAFGAYFKLSQGSPSNSSHVDLWAPVSMEPTNASVGLAWLAVGSMCLFTAGERGPMSGEAGWGAMGMPCHCWVPMAPSKSRPSWPHLSMQVPTSAFIPLTMCQIPT